jgi:hypothetical protein
MSSFLVHIMNEACATKFVQFKISESHPYCFSIHHSLEMATIKLIFNEHNNLMHKEFGCVKTLGGLYDKLLNSVTLNHKRTKCTSKERRKKTR